MSTKREVKQKIMTVRIGGTDGNQRAIYYQQCGRVSTRTENRPYIVDMPDMDELVFGTRDRN